MDKSLLPYSTIRKVDCHVLLSPSNKQQRCPSCSSYRPTLRSLVSHQKSNVALRTNLSSKVNDRWLTKEEMKCKMDKMRGLNKATVEKLRRREQKLIETLEKEGLEVKLYLIFIEEH